MDNKDLSLGVNNEIKSNDNESTISDDRGGNHTERGSTVDPNNIGQPVHATTEPIKNEQQSTREAIRSSDSHPTQMDSSSTIEDETGINIKSNDDLNGTQISGTSRSSSSVEDGESKPLVGNGKTRFEWDQYTNNSILNNNFDFSQVDIPEQKESRWAANIAALSLLKKYENSDHLYSHSEKEILAKFTGWGALSSLIYDNKDELLAIVDKKEFDQIQRSSLDSYYTSDKIVKGIWNGLDHLGVLNDDEKINILEPSSGTGNFIKHAPSKIKDDTNIVAVELDKTSANIFDGLFPASTTINKPFEESGLLSKSFDLVVANPPYGDHRIYDPNSKYSSKTIANYFVGESLEKLRDGGIGVYVVSSRFLDSHGKVAEETSDKPNPFPSDHDKGIRGLIGENASFLGAVRLPSNAFSHTDTSVVTDVIFFKKGAPDFSDSFTQSVNKRWINTEKIALSHVNNEESIEEIRINEYFVNNPQNILGSSHITKDRFGKRVFVCQSDGRDLEEAISDFVKNEIKPNLYIKKSAAKVEKDKNINVFDLNNLPKALVNIPVNTFYTDDKNAYVRESNAIVDGIDCAVIRTIPLSKNLLKRASDYCLVRDSLNNLLDLEKSLDSSDQALLKLNTARKNLNNNYDNYVKKHGFLNSSRSTTEMRRNCKEFFKVRALEVNYLPALSEKQAKKQNGEPRPESAGKADVFKKRTIHNVNEVLKISTYKDAHIASLNKYGKVNIDYITSFFPTINKDEVINSLLEEKLIFPNLDDKENSEPFINAEKLLFGNVLTKLQDYETKFNESNSSEEGINIYKHAVDILTFNQPDPISAADISVNMGAPYIGNKIVNQFFSEKLGQKWTEFNTEYHAESGSWFVKADIGFFKGQSIRNNEGYNEDVYQKYFTPEIHPKTLLTCILHQKPIMAFKTHKEADGSTYKEFLPEQTHIANMKATKLKEDFKKWLFESQDRRREVEEKYNKTYNTHAKNTFDGSHLTLNGLNEKIILRPHQKNAIWRAIQQGNTLFDHTVGAGKTYATIASIMEMKRMGLKNKPLVIVPNNLLYQWAADWKKAYPAANILVPSPDDMSKNNREHFFGKIALNDYDAVLMTHSQFTHIDAPIETQRKLLEKELELIESLHYVEQSVMERSDTQKRAAEKSLIKRKDTVSRKLKELDDVYSSSDVFDFDDLGIDFLAVDELHLYKNLFITTKMQGIAGLGNLNGSGKAFDLYAKVQYLQDTYDGKGLLGATGTPISNTIAEMYTLQRYFQPNDLAEKNIGSFDAWAATFGQAVSSWELDASGVNYKITNRFSKFQNVPELQQMYQQFADIINNDDIKKLDPDFVPKLEGGKPKNIVAERSYDVAKYIGVYDEATKSYNVGSIIHRMNNPHEDIRKNNMLACTTDARKAGLTYKLIDPSAEEDRGSKLHLVADHAFEVYQNSNSVKGTQLIFCDLSVPKTHSQNSNDEIQEEVVFIEAGQEEKNIKVQAPTLTNDDDDTNIKFGSDDYLAMEEERKINYDVYNDVLNKLVEKGVPRKEIAFIHDAHTDALKAELFAKVNSGEVRILLGSTAKMGAGTNVQERIVAVHHLDCPWRPSDLEQRNGRAIRQGNVLFEADKKNFRIQEFRYATAGTYDSRMWQVQESKSIGLESFRSSAVSKSRVIDDCSMDSANAAEMKALASGNPLILMEVQIKQEKMKYDALHSEHNSRKYKLEDQLRKYSKSELVIENFENNLRLAEKYLPSVEKTETHHYTGYNPQTETESEAPNRLIKIKNPLGGYNDYSVHPHSKSQENTESLHKLLDGFKEFATKPVPQNGISIGFEDFIKYQGLSVDLEKFSKDSQGVMSIIINLKDEDGNRITTQSNNIIMRIKSNDKGVMEFRPNTLFNNIDKFLYEYRKNIQERIDNERKNISLREELKIQIAQPFEHEEIYNALIEDDLTVINELNKQSADNDYVSDFTPKYEQYTSTIKKDTNKDVDVESNEIEVKEQLMTLDYFNNLEGLVLEKSAEKAEKEAQELSAEENVLNNLNIPLSGQETNVLEINETSMAEDMVKDYPDTIAKDIQNDFEAKALAKGFANDFIKEKVSFIKSNSLSKGKDDVEKSNHKSTKQKNPLFENMSQLIVSNKEYFSIWKKSSKDEIKESIKDDTAFTAFSRVQGFIRHYNESFGDKDLLSSTGKKIIETFTEHATQKLNTTEFPENDRDDTKNRLLKAILEAKEIIRDYEVDIRLKGSQEQNNLNPHFKLENERDDYSIYREPLQLTVDRLRGILHEVKHNDSGLAENLKYFDAVQNRGFKIMKASASKFHFMENDDPEKIEYKAASDLYHSYVQEIKRASYEPRTNKDEVEPEQTETPTQAVESQKSLLEKFIAANTQLENIIQDHFSTGEIPENETMIQLKENIDNVRTEAQSLLNFDVKNDFLGFYETNEKLSENYMIVSELINLETYEKHDGQLIGVIANESIEATRLRMDVIEGLINSSKDNSFVEKYPYALDMTLSISACINQLDKTTAQDLTKLNDLIKLKSKEETSGITYDENGNVDIFAEPSENNSIIISEIDRIEEPSNEIDKDPAFENLDLYPIVKKEVESLLMMGHLTNGLTVDHIIKYTNDNYNESKETKDAKQAAKLTILKPVIQLAHIFKENTEESGKINIDNVVKQIKSTSELEIHVLENLNSSSSKRGLVGYEPKILGQLIEECNTHISAKYCSAIAKKLSENDLATLPIEKLIKHDAMRKCYSLSQSENPIDFKNDLKLESYDQISDRISWIIKEMEDTKNISQPLVLSLIETELYSSISVEPSEDGRVDYSDDNDKYDFIDISKGSKNERSSALDLLRKATALKDSIYKFEIEKHGNGLISEFYKNMPKEKYFYTCMAKMNDINNDIKYHQTFDKTLLKELKAIEVSANIRHDTPLNKTIASNANQLIDAYRFNKPKNEAEKNLDLISQQSSLEHYELRETFPTISNEELKTRVDSLIWELNIDNGIHEERVIDELNTEIINRLTKPDLSDQIKIDLKKIKNTIDVVANEVNYSVKDSLPLNPPDKKIITDISEKPVDFKNESIKASNHRLDSLNRELKLSGSLSNPATVIEIKENVDRLVKEAENDVEISDSNLSNISAAYNKIDNIVNNTKDVIDYDAVNSIMPKLTINKSEIILDDFIGYNKEYEPEKISQDIIPQNLNIKPKSSSYEEEILNEVKENVGINIQSIFENIESSIESIQSNNFVVMLDLPNDSSQLKPLEKFSVINAEYDLSKKLLNTEKLINSLCANGVIEEFQQLVIENEIHSKFNKLQNDIDSIKSNNNFTTISTKEELKEFIEIKSDILADKISSYTKSKDTFSAERNNDDVSNIFSSLKDLRKDANQFVDNANEEKIQKAKEIQQQEVKNLKPKEERLMTMKMCFNTAPASFTDNASPSEQKRLLGYLWKKNGFNANNLGILVKEFQEFSKIHNKGKYPKILNPNLEKYDLNTILKKNEVGSNNLNNNPNQLKPNFRNKV